MMSTSVAKEHDPVPDKQADQTKDDFTTAASAAPPADKSATSGGDGGDGGGYKGPKPADP